MNRLPDTRQARWTLTDDSGAELVAFTSCLDVEIKEESRTASSPVERGGFASYNKTDSPLEIYVTLGIQGDDATLQNALDSLRELKSGTRLLNVVTPNAEYTSLTLESYNYKRSRENGLGVLFVELHLVEIRQVESQYTTVSVPPIKKGDAKKAGDASKVDRGKLQAKPYDAVLWKMGKKSGGLF